MMRRRVRALSKLVIMVCGGVGATFIYMFTRCLPLYILTIFISGVLMYIVDRCVREEY